MKNLNEQLQFGLAVVTSKGLLFNGKFYTNASMVKNNWFEQVESEGEWQIPILYQNSNQERLFLLDLQSNEVATAIEHCHQTESIHIYHEHIQSLKKQYYDERNH